MSRTIQPIETQPLPNPDNKVNRDIINNPIDSPLSVLLFVFLSIGIIQKFLSYAKIPVKLFTNFTAIGKEELELLAKIENLMYLLMGETGSSRCVIGFFHNTEFRSYTQATECFLHDKKVSVIFETHLPHIKSIKSEIQNIKLSKEILREIDYCVKCDGFVLFSATKYAHTTGNDNIISDPRCDKYFLLNNIWKKASLILDHEKSYFGILNLFYEHTGDYHNEDVNTNTVKRIKEELLKLLVLYRFPKKPNYWNRFFNFLKDIAD